MNFTKHKTSYLFLVADGHGPNGAEVSEFVRMRFPINLGSESNLKIDENTENNNSHLVKSNSVKASFMNAYRKTNNDLKHQNFNSLLSGCTLTTILIIN